MRVLVEHSRVAKPIQSANLGIDQAKKPCMPGELIIRWTARVAVACYVTRLLYDAGHQHDTRSQQRARWWWTLGCGWFVLHVASAFHYLHGWNHAAAVAYTARRTAELTGWNSGVGLYVNELFLALWLVDTIMWWREISWPSNRRMYWLVQSVFAFLMLQATAIFGPPFWIPIAIGVVDLLAVVHCVSSQSRHQPPSNGSPNSEGRSSC